jgi:O-antigen chain-terminating methyltransferase
MNLSKVFAQLPEVYQPIYNHPELSTKVSRDCLSRLEIIKKIINEMSKFLNRKLRILDIGCSQGFFSFNACRLGHEVLGIDYLDKNINLCNELKKENKDFKINFVVSDLKDINKILEKNDFDLVLGLSVFHHFIHENINGLELAKEIINCIQKKCGAAIFEFALTSEPLYWSKSQPKFVHELIQKIRYNYFIDEQVTHLSEIKRPIIFSSDQYIYYENFFSKIEQFKENSHTNDDFTHKRSRKYFLFDKTILKTFDLETDERKKMNLEESKNEIKILKDREISIPLPKLLFSNFNSFQSIIHREKYQGETLDEHIINKKYNPNEICKKILTILEKFEKKKLYFEDLRLWNFIIDDENEIKLIDYGSLNAFKIDEFKLFQIKSDLNLIFYEIFYKKIFYPIPFRSTKFSEMHYDFPLNILIKKIWDLQINSFSYLEVLSLFNKYENLKIDNDKYQKSSTEIKLFLYEKNIDYLSEEIKQMKLFNKSLDLKIENNSSFINKIRNNYIFKILKKFFYKA